MPLSNSLLQANTILLYPAKHYKPKPTCQQTYYTKPYINMKPIHEYQPRKYKLAYINDLTMQTKPKQYQKTMNNHTIVQQSSQTYILHPSSCSQSNLKHATLWLPTIQPATSTKSAASRQTHNRPITHNNYPTKSVYNGTKIGLRQMHTLHDLHPINHKQPVKQHELQK